MPQLFFYCSSCGESVLDDQQPLDADGHPEDECTKCGTVGSMSGIEGEHALEVVDRYGHDAAERVMAREARRRGERWLADSERHRRGARP